MQNTNLAKKNNNQKGFGLLGLLIVALIIGLIYFGYNHASKPKTTNKDDITNLDTSNNADVIHAGKKAENDLKASNQKMIDEQNNAQKILNGQ